MDKYSLNSESYGIPKKEWKTIKSYVVHNQLNSEDAIKEFRLDWDNDELCSKRVWFLYDVLLQGKYKHLYIKEA